VRGDDTKKCWKRSFAQNARRLGAEYEKLGWTYTTAIHDLTTGAGTSSREEYAKMRISVEDARLTWEVSRVKLLEHKQTHKPPPP
jgi:hypothetical protein